MSIFTKTTTTFFFNKNELIIDTLTLDDEDYVGITTNKTVKKLFRQDTYSSKEYRLLIPTLYLRSIITEKDGVVIINISSRDKRLKRRIYTDVYKYDIATEDISFSRRQTTLKI